MVVVVGAAAWFAGCSQNVVDPDEFRTNVVDSYFVPRQEDSNGVARNPGVPVLDGERLDIEWGSPDLKDIPWKAVRMTGEEGSGNPGSPIFAFVKSVYTEKHVYFLVQWKDETQSDRKDILTYTGPDLAALEADRCYPEYYQNPAYWVRQYDEDRVSFAFELTGGGGAGGFAQRGCMSACHGSAFGVPAAGEALDVWQWLAARTNQPLIKFNPTDSDIFPREGWTGYADDYVSDAGGLSPDESDPAAAPYELNSKDGTTVPRYVYKGSVDNCVPVNGGITPKNAFLWGPCISASWNFSVCDTMNEAPTDQTQPRKWRTGDIAAGYILKAPLGSRADVRAKGIWDDEQRVWTLELARALETGDTVKDVQFDLETGLEYRFALMIADNSQTTHHGSEVLVLRFVPAR